MITLQIGENRYELFQIPTSTFEYHVYDKRGEEGPDPCPDLISSKRRQTFQSNEPTEFLTTFAVPIKNSYTSYLYNAIVINRERYGAKLCNTRDLFETLQSEFGIGSAVEIFVHTTGERAEIIRNRARETGTLDTYVPERLTEKMVLIKDRIIITVRNHGYLQSRENNKGILGEHKA